MKASSRLQNPKTQARLLTLAAFLDAKAPPILLMDRFVAGANTRVTQFLRANEDEAGTTCGTPGCAGGYIPTVFPEWTHDWIEGVNDPDPDWGEMIRAFMGVPDNGDQEIENMTHWIFSSSWSNIDTTAKGAAARIWYLIDKGLPSNWKKQMMGETDLEYLNLILEAG